MASNRTGDSTPRFDFSMLGEAEIAALAGALASKGDAGDDEARIIDELRGALASARASAPAQDSDDERLGRALVSGGITCKDGIELFERAYSSGCYFVLVVAPTNPAAAKQVNKLTEKIRSALPFSRVVVVEGVIAVVLPSESTALPDDLVGRLVSMSAVNGAVFSIGASEPTQHLELVQICFDHARFAAEVARQEGESFIPYRERCFEYLVARTDIEEEFAYLRDMRVLGIYESDSQRGSDLLATAITYIQSGFSLAKTAALMNLHRNSVVYRLNRIAERSGIDLLGSCEDVDLLTMLLTCKLYRARLDEDAVPAEWIPSC